MFAGWEKRQRGVQQHRQERWQTTRESLHTHTNTHTCTYVRYKMCPRVAAATAGPRYRFTISIKYRRWPPGVCRTEVIIQMFPDAKCWLTTMFAVARPSPSGWKMTRVPPTCCNCEKSASRRAQVALTRLMLVKHISRWNVVKNPWFQVES